MKADDKNDEIEEIALGKPKTQRFPTVAWLIIGCEFSERFCFYGMKAILTMYLKSFLQLSAINATSIYHIFTIMCYFMPIMGAVIADGFLGRYRLPNIFGFLIRNSRERCLKVKNNNLKAQTLSVGLIISRQLRTIKYLSMVYILGLSLLTMTSIPHIGRRHSIWAVISLMLIAIGTGGIKPCVSSFGADQLQENQEQTTQRFFSIFYMSINAGSFISTIITPLARGVQCYGPPMIESKCSDQPYATSTIMGSNTEFPRNITPVIIDLTKDELFFEDDLDYDCYSLAFIIPTIAMIVATGIFMTGTKYYKKLPPQGSMILRFVKAFKASIVSWFKSKPVIESRMDNSYGIFRHAPDEYKDDEVRNFQLVLSTIKLFLPLCFFWTLYDQTGSSWILQGKEMANKLGSINITPDMMQCINPLLVMIMVPLFETYLYPFCYRRKFMTTQLDKMIVGMFTLASSFVVSAVLQYFVQHSFHVHIMWQVVPYIQLTAAEILFSIPGLHFAYAEAPESMKSLMTAVWLLTTSMGNVFTLIINAFAQTTNAPWLFILYAIIVTVMAILFKFLVKRYNRKKQTIPTQL